MVMLCAMSSFLNRFTPSGAPVGRQPGIGTVLAVLGCVFGVVAGRMLEPAFGDNFLFLLFIRFVPIMPMSEIKMVIPAADPHGSEKH